MILSSPRWGSSSLITSPCPLLLRMASSSIFSRHIAKTNPSNSGSLTSIFSQISKRPPGILPNINIHLCHILGSSPRSIGNDPAAIFKREDESGLSFPWEPKRSRAMKKSSISSSNLCRLMSRLKACACLRARAGFPSERVYGMASSTSLVSTRQAS